mgnify:CR=1 FL=1
MKRIVEENLRKKEFIITHGLVWDYYFWGTPYQVIKDIEWYGSHDLRKSRIYPSYIENSGVIILDKSRINQFPEWQYHDQFEFKKEIDDWYIFARER